MLKYGWVIKLNVLIISITTVPTPNIGSLSFFEAERDIPFSIKRIYYIHSVPENTERGAHAHKELKQLLFCPYGSVKILLDNGKEKSEVILDDPSKGLIITPCIWRDMVWLVENSVLCVAASDYYNEGDYIRDYSEFITWINSHEYWV